MGKWRTGSRRPKKPLEVEFHGELYKGWVSEIFRAILRRAAAEGRRLSPGWEDQVWHAMAEKYPHYIQMDPDHANAPVTVSVASVMNFVKFVRKRGWNRTVVSTQEAERRAEICRECPKAALMSGCSACKEAARTLIGTPAVSLDFGKEGGKSKEACSACDCYLDLKVWIPMELLAEEIGQFDFHPSCWMLEPSLS